MNGGKIRKMVLPVLLLAFLLVVSGFFLWRVYVQSQSERQSLWQSVSGLTEENSRLSEENAQWQQKFDALARSQEVQPEEYAAALASLQLFQHLPDQPSLERGASIRLKPSKKYVYLTFDDGPSENTPALLEVLGKNNVKATFFVVYNSNKQYYQDIVCAGHAIGLHSYTHDYAKIYQSEDAYFADLQQLSDYVKDACGVESKLLRFPGGSSNTVSRH